MTRKKRSLLGSLILVTVAGLAFHYFSGNSMNRLFRTGGGSGQVIVSGSKVSGTFTIKNAATGELIMESGNPTDGSVIEIGKDQFLPGVDQALMGKSVGFVHIVKMTGSEMRRTPVGTRLADSFRIPDDLTVEVSGTVLKIQD